MSGVPSGRRRRFWLDKHGAALHIAGHLIDLKPPTARAYWSERERIGCRVWPLLGGWRLVHRRRHT